MAGRESSRGYGGGVEPSSASGSPPESGSSDESWFEVLNAPLPSETQEERALREASPEVDPGALLGSRRGAGSPRDDSPSMGSAQTGRTRARRGAARRVRRTIKHIDPLSVLKISLITYAALLLGWLLFVAIFYNFLDGLGLFDTVNSALRGFAYDEVNITLGVVERWAFIGGIVVMIGGSILNVLLALVYNITSRLLGGIEVTFVERDA